jgi:hypothetical protein
MIEGCRITGRYYSRRNRVFRAEMPQGEAGVQCLVIKEFTTAAAAQREYSNLLQLAAAGVTVPTPLGLEGRRLYLQHLEGVLLADILEKDLVSSELWTKALAGWYARLHAQTAPGDSNALLKTDNNLRNFIFREGLFYGLDFELLSPGDPARDLGQICAFILADRPSFTPGKLAAASGLIRHYRCLNKLPVSRIREELIRELERMAERRREESSSIKSFLGSCQGKINLFS